MTTQIQVITFIAPTEKKYWEGEGYLARRSVQLTTKVKTTQIERKTCYLNNDNEIWARADMNKRSIELTDKADEETLSKLKKIFGNK
jgi:hypothetical protein